MVVSFENLVNTVMVVMMVVSFENLVNTFRTRLSI